MIRSNDPHKKEEPEMKQSSLNYQIDQNNTTKHSVMHNLPKKRKAKQ